MIFNPRKKQLPFSALFQRLSPKRFVFTFHAEKIQTLAFILSYAPGSYARRVIKLMEDKDIRKTLAELLRTIKHEKETTIPKFVAEIERAALEYIGESV